MTDTDARLQTLRAKLRDIYDHATAPQRPAYLQLPNHGGSKRVAFINSIGGLGDCFPILLAIQLYKHYFPHDTTILYDSLFLHHYYELPDYVDEVYQASEHIHAGYIPRMILDTDPTLPRHGGVALSDLACTHIVSTHHAHKRILGPDSMVIKMDFEEMCKDSILHGFLPLCLQLKPEFAQQVDALHASLTSDGRMLVAVQNRAKDPYKNLALEEPEYQRELEALVRALVHRYNARVLLCGDLRLQPPDCVAGRDYVELDLAVANIYSKFDLLRRCAYFFAAPSGFSLNVSYLRHSHQSPAILCFPSSQRFFDSLKTMYPDYTLHGGGSDGVIVAFTYQHPALSEFILQEPHNHATILTFFEGLLSQFGITGQQHPGASSWLVGSLSQPQSPSSDSELAPEHTLANQPEELTSQLHAAAQLLDDGHTQQALQAYRELAHCYPDSEAALLGFAGCHRRAQDWSAAADAYRACRERFPRSVAAHVNLGATLRVLGQRTEALSVCNRALRYFPDIPELYYNRANLWSDFNKTQNALLDYKRALELKPDFDAAAESLGRLLVKAGELDLAYSLATTWARNFPNAAALWRLVGFVCEQLTRHAEAEQAYLRAYQLNPADKDAQVFAFHQKQVSCQWDSWDERGSQLLSDRVHDIRPASAVMLPTSHQTQIKCAAHWWAKHFPLQPHERPEHFRTRFKRTSKIRLAYVN